MHPALRNILAVIAGIILGSMANMGIILLSGSIIPPPDGVDTTTMEGLEAGMHLMQPKHFIMPFLAHAIGTLVGAYIAARLGASRNKLLALIIGFFFLMGGIANMMMLPSPLWYTVIDLTLCYIPMAFVGWKLASRSIGSATD